MQETEDDFDTLGFPSAAAREFPTIVNVEAYRGACPCCCVHCPVGATDPAERPRRFGVKGMSLELYDRIARELASHPASMLRVHSVGDAILWDDLPEALHISKATRARPWVFTCAVTRDKRLLDALCDLAAVVEVSVNSMNAADYRDTKGIDAFELVTENIQYMHKRAAAGAPVRLLVSRVQSAGSESDERFIQYWKSTGVVDDAFIRLYHTYNDALPGPPLCQGATGHQPCLVHWARFNVSVDGHAVVCFNELFKEHLDPSLVLGDVNTQSISDIWHGPKLAALRKAELSGDYSDLPFSGALPCKGCSLCQPLHGDQETSEHQLSQLGDGESLRAGAS